MRSIEDCIKHLEEHVNTCNILIAGFPKGGPHYRYEMKQREAYEDCIAHLKNLLEVEKGLEEALNYDNNK